MSLSPDTLLQTDTVRVRIMSLAPSEVAPLHFHTKVSEHVVCLEGEITVSIRSGKDAGLLPGECVSIPPGVHHQLINRSAAVSKYLLTQSGGAYDFCPVSA